MIKIPTPKYHIGDIVMRIRDNKIAEEIVYGVVGRCDYEEKKFSSFYYFLELKESHQGWGWVKEEDLHISKSALLNSL